MRTLAQYQNPERRCAELAAQLIDSRLCIVVGAGLSIPFGGALWGAMIERLFRKYDRTAPGGDFRRQAEVFKLECCGGDRGTYLKAVHDAIYEGVDDDFEKLLYESKTMAAIAMLVMASIRGSASHIITFNFDNLLERYLEYHGFVAQAIVSPYQWAAAADVSILHPHGFLPRNDTAGWTDVVLDRESYSEYRADKSNPWPGYMLSLMRRRTCLFVGTSGDDDNLDEMMVSVRQRHPAIKGGSLFWGIRLAAEDDDGKAGTDAALWESRGVYMARIKDYKDDLPRELLRICQAAARLRRSSAFAR